MLLPFSPWGTSISTCSYLTHQVLWGRFLCPLQTYSLVMTWCVHTKRSLIGQISTVKHSAIATERYRGLSNHVFNEVLQKNDSYRVFPENKT